MSRRNSARVKGPLHTWFFDIVTVLVWAVLTSCFCGTDIVLGAAVSSHHLVLSLLGICCVVSALLQTAAVSVLRHPQAYRTCAPVLW